jgi:hypothetical protein
MAWETTYTHVNLCPQLQKYDDLRPGFVNSSLPIVRASLKRTLAQHQLSFPTFPSVKMFRTVLPRVSRALPHNATASKRFLTTAPPHKTSRSWKNSAARWTLAGGLIYYYNTSNVFAEEPICTF